MSDLAEWLEQQQALAEETVDFRGRHLLVRELPLHELDAIAEASRGKDGGEFEGRIVAACVCDPETKQPVKPDDWQFWSKLGTSFLPVKRAVIRLNKLNNDGVEDAVKK